MILETFMFMEHYQVLMLFEMTLVCV